MRSGPKTKHLLALALAPLALAMIAAVTPAAAGHARAALGSRILPGSARGAALTLAIKADETQTGPTPNEIRIARGPRRYVIDSNGSLPVPQVNGVPVPECVNPTGNPDRLLCLKGAIGGFKVITLGGNDTVTATRSVRVPTLIKGGTGLDDLYGGSSSDKLVGGDGADKLVGRGGSDSLYGGAGPDKLFGGNGRDLLRGGPGRDLLRGGPGRDDPKQ